MARKTQPHCGPVMQPGGRTHRSWLLYYFDPPGDREIDIVKKARHVPIFDGEKHFLVEN